MPFALTDEKEAFVVRIVPGNVFTASARAIEALEAQQSFRGTVQKRISEVVDDDCDRAAAKQGEFVEENAGTWASPNDPRDEWLYQQRIDGKPYKQIIAELARIPRGWEPLRDAGSVNAAINRYCQRHQDKPLPPKRNRGRPKRK
jgi:hypothetical protein